MLTLQCHWKTVISVFFISTAVEGAELKFTHLGENITSISVNKFVSVTFALNVSACDLPRRLYTIKVGTRTIAGSLEYDGSITFFETSRCSETLNTSVRCTTPAGPAELYREVNRSHVQIEWKWQWKNLQSSRYLNNQKELKLNVLYPPSVTSLTMNGLEVNGDHLIDEGEINISCSFDQGNPHSNFLLLSEQGKEMNALRAEKYLNGSLLISCHLDWPTIRCEGNGSNVNRSVSLLVRCCPQFKSKYPKVTTNKTHENWTFHVRSHAKEIKNCLLTPMSLKENASKDVNCTLIGDPPEMLLTVALDKEDIEKERKWALKFSNERGFSDPLVFRIVSREDKQSEGKPILSVIIGAVVGSVVAVAVIVVIVIVVIRRRRADPTYASPKSRPAPGEEHEYMDLSDTAGQPNRTADSEQRKQEEGAYEVPVFPPS